MPRVLTAIIPTFSDEQLQALLAVPDKRTRPGIRDRAIILVLLDSLIRASEHQGRGRREPRSPGRVNVNWPHDGPTAVTR